MLAHVIKQVSSIVESKKEKHNTHFPQRPYNKSSAIINTSTPLLLCTEIIQIIVSIEMAATSSRGRGRAGRESKCSARAQENQEEEVAVPETLHQKLWHRTKSLTDRLWH